MAIYKRTRRSHRLRTSETPRDSSLERRETPARTNRSRPSRRLGEASSHRYGKLRYRMAAVAAVVLGMPVLVELPTLDAIIYRESRCLSYVVNRTLNKDKSHDYGLTQINGRSWCEPTRYYPNGYLQTLGILKECDDLLNPVTNLEAAFALYTYAKGFGPWT